METGHSVRAITEPVASVGILLDSFSIGGVYAVMPRGGYSGGMWYARSPEKDVYAGTIGKHPTGLVFPVGLPIRVLAEGGVLSRSTAAFQTGYCARYGATDPICSVASFMYTVHGLAPGPGVPRPYEPGMGLALTWSRTAGYYDRLYAEHPVAEFFRGPVPAADTATRRELHFNRVGCCYYIPWGTTAAWESYEGVWRFGAVPDDGGRAELGLPPVLRLSGPRTDAPQTEPANFTAEVAAGDSIMTTRWWFVRAANNVFDGERVDSVATGTPYPPYIPRYPEAKRAAFTELGACAGQRTCAYQAPEAGAVLVQATMASGVVLAARNTGRSGAHVRITVDSTTLAYGDTTVFRVTAPGAGRLEVMGFSFVPVSVVAVEAGQALREVSALRRAGTMGRQVNDTRRPAVSRLPALSRRQNAQASPSASTPGGVSVVRGRPKAHFLDAALECSEAAIEVCYDNPLQTGYEVVTAKVDGEVQRDSVLVTVVPVLKLTCSDVHGVSDARGGATVVRAESVSCKVTLVPEETSDKLTVTDWNFVSLDGTLSRNRHDVNPEFNPDSTVWAGPLITSGKIAVTAFIGQTSPSTKMVTVSVTPRRWSKDSIPDFPSRPDLIGQGWLPTRPDSVHDLGQIRFQWKDNGVMDTSAYRGLVEDGPNALFYYVKRMPPVLEWVRIAVNEAALQRNSGFYLAQPSGLAGNVYNAENPCLREDVISADTRNKILAHEGSDWQLNPVSHAGRMRQLAFERLPAAAESVFVKADAGGPQALMDRYHILVLKGVALKIDTLANKPIDAANPVHFGAGRRLGCTFVYPSR